MGLFDWLRPTTPLDAATRALVDQAVSATDPLLRTVSGHERRLAPAVRHAFDYCQRLAMAIPGPIPITRAAFASEPLVHALFASADDIDTMLARSQCVRGHLINMTGLPGGQCCALLGMRHREKVGFGARLTGDVISLDAVQKTLYFTDHTLAEPSPDLDGAHQRLAQRMFDGLLKGFATHVTEVRSERKQLCGQQTVQRAFEAAGEPYTRRQADLQDRLRATDDALQPAQLMDALIDYLAAPEAALHLDAIKMSVDRAGVIVTSDDELANVDTVRFVELTARDQRRWVVMIVRIDREEARAAVERFDEARRNIVI
jgi:hypothetical protein